MKVPGMLTVLFVSLGSLITTSPAAGQDDPLLHDAEHYAATYDVKLDEALYRLRLQPAIGRLNEALAKQESATFAGLWVQHEPSYLIIVQFTAGGGAGLQTLLKNEEFYEPHPFVDVRTAKRSLAELATVQTAALEVARAQGVPMESSINVPANRVDLFTTEPDFLVSALRAADEARAATALPLLEENVAIVMVDALSAPARYLNAGHHLSSCTSGFSVQNASGTRGVLTAGHCSNIQAFNTRNLPFQSEAFSGSRDVQWHSAVPVSQELHVVNRIWDGLFDTTTPNYRFITATKPRAQQFVGEIVCKYGMATRATCGNISSTTFAPIYVSSAAATFIVVHSDTQDQGEGGDSGGPWYSGSTAYGVHSGSFPAPNLDAIYMAIDFISALGVSVLTTTPPLNVGRFTFRAMGDNIDAYTEINLNDYVCGLAGLAARDGDIQENGAGAILLSQLYGANNHFNFLGGFRTHNNGESWDFDLLCLKKSVYSAGKFDFNNLGNNVNFNTGLSTTTYECGIDGITAGDGDIEEHDAGDIVQAYMYRSGGQWWIRADFRSHNFHETWNVDVLCVNRVHPVVRYEFKNLGDNVNFYDTFINSNIYECGIAGFAARDGDINEDGSGDIIQAFLFILGGTWRIRADFRSHNNSESWDIDVLCVQR